MKAISLKQPYANWIAEGKKTLETRTWATKHRGNLLIVSSRLPALEPAGYAVAVVEVIACRPMTEQDEQAACVSLYPKAWVWELAHIHRIKPIPLKGSLGIYSVPIEISDLEYI
ncbi:MAG TPA: ASCH domain-containing protein [Patescibacteria group bacterium]